jgi:hypothetical protein
MLKKIAKIKNGDLLVDFYIYECNVCETEIEECHPHHNGGNDYHLCLDCSFKQGKVTSRQYLDLAGMSIDSINAGIDPNGEIKLWWGRNPIPPWEREPRQQRNSPEYKKWRDDVFQRDGYTCQTCGVRGGTLNAHHVKAFADHPELRLALSNGVTLCVGCHRERHRVEGYS